MKKGIYFVCVFLLVFITMVSFVYAECLKENEIGVYGNDTCCPGLKEEAFQTATVGSVAHVVCTKCTGNNCDVPKNNNSNDGVNLVGNDSDEHGCKGSAGYSWCEEKNKCLRIWEENCSSNKTLPGEGKVKILPETASLTAQERLGDLGFNVSLKEVGNGSENKSYYEVSAEKEGKMFGLFKVKGKVSVDVDAETGEVLKVHKPWWSFLATGI